MPACCRRLLRDPVFLIGVALVALLSAPSLLLSDPESLAAYRSLYREIPLMVLAIVALLVRAGREGTLAARRFWWLWAIAMACWVIVRAINLSIGFGAEWDRPVGLLTDLLYGGFYFCIIAALEVKPGVARGLGRPATLTALGALAFVFGFFVYYAVLPAIWDHAEYDTWVPSMLFYATLDGYLVLRLTSRLYFCEAEGWRSRYATLLVAAATWMIVDGLDTAASIGAPIDAQVDGLFNLLWFLPLLSVIAATRIDAAPGKDDEAPDAESQEAIRSLWGGPLVAYAVAFPIVHVGVYASDVLGSPAVQRPRDVTALSLLVLLSAMAYAYQRQLRLENVRLRAERRAVNEQLRLAQRMEAVGRLAGGVAHDFNNLLQIIRACASFLVNDVGEESEGRRRIAEIEQASERAARLTDQLLTVGCQKPFEPEPTSLNDVVTDMVSLLRRTLGTDVEIVLRTGGSIEPVLVDRLQLERLDPEPLHQRPRRDAPRR